MSFLQMPDFTFKHSDQVDPLYTQYTGPQIKALFDSRGIELRNALNTLVQLLNSVNGASNIGTSTIQDIDGANIQAMLQSIRDKLKSTLDGSSGADYINATAISGITGSTVQTILKSLKAYIDTVNTNQSQNLNTHKISMDHDNRYFTKDQLQSAASGSSGADNIKATPIHVNSGDTVQEQLAWLLSQIAIAATGSIPDGSLSEVKLTQALINKINTALSNTGVLTSLQTKDKSSSVNAINEVNNTVESHLAESVILTAGGTANAITLDITLKDKNKYSFKASANSTDLVTINGKLFKKLDGTQIGSGGIKANKVYDFYYDLSTDSVFILAKAEGTAVVENVLAGKTFSNDNDNGLEGTMIDNGAVVITPSTVNQIIPIGYHNGSGIVTAITLKSGTNLIYNNSTPANSITPSYSKVKEVRINYSGFIRVSFNVGSVETSKARIYINGVPKGIERTIHTSMDVYVTYTEDFVINTGDLVQLYMYTLNGINFPCYNQFLQIFIDLLPFAG